MCAGIEALPSDAEATHVFEVSDPEINYLLRRLATPKGDSSQDAATRVHLVDRLRQMQPDATAASP